MGRFSRFGETDTFSKTLRFAALLRWASGSLKQDVLVAVEAVKQDGTALQVVSEVCSDGSVVSAFLALLEVAFQVLPEKTTLATESWRIIGNFYFLATPNHMT